MPKSSLRCLDPTTGALLKLAAAVLIFASSSAGVAIPLVWRRRRSGGVFPPFAMAKAFVAGVILATALVHMLSEAWKSLALASGWIWSKFPVAGFVAMMAALGTVLIECLRMKGKEKGKERLVNCAPCEEGGLKSDGEKQVRHSLISQVLELGIVSHSIIMGVSLGISQSPCSIRPLTIALFLHQFFKGFALGGFISQAQFENHKEILMAFFFAITTPTGIAVGAIAMAFVYDPRSSVAEAIADSLSAGILMYISLVDLIVMDLLELLKRSRFRVQVGIYAALIGGAVLMSLLALWA